MGNKLLEPLLDDSVYRDVFHSLAHFSAKLTNTNTKGGIRVDQQHSEDLPYASVSSALYSCAAIDLDYIRGAGDSKAFKHLQHSRRSFPDDRESNLKEKIAKGASKKEVQKIKEQLKAHLDRVEAKTHFAPVNNLFASMTLAAEEFQSDELSPRLPQVLLPKGNDYVAFTPLASAGYSRHLNTIGRERKAQISQAERSLGGMNSQNIGGLVFEARRVFVLPAPRENESVKRQFSWAHKGVRVKLSKTAFLEYLEWRGRLLDGDCSTQHNKRLRDTEDRHVLKVAAPFFSRLRAARAEVSALPSDSIVHQSAHKSEFHLACLNYIAGRFVTRADCKVIGERLVADIRRWKTADGRQIAWQQSEVKRFGRLLAEVIND